MKKSELREMIKEEMLSEAKVGFDDYSIQNIIRHIPTGALVKTKIEGKTLKINVVIALSTAPLTTKDIVGVERSLNKDVKAFIGDAVNFGVPVSKSSVHPYIFMGTRKKDVTFSLDFSIEVKTKPEVKILEQLADSLKQYNVLR